ncbi:MAG: hypothetical protein K2N26_06790 [Oscillospiraceae bacterium]|nr:hypothetical protein [Oscillospiraceae bacterium]MDE7279414.1 hypothetical protein [Oscillospiraceae bacterium]
MALQDCGKLFYCQYYVKSSQSTVDFHITDYFTAPLVSFIKCKSGEPAKIAASLPDDGAF